MRALLGVLVALGLAAASATQSSAMIKLRPKCKVVEVPPTATFVVEIDVDQKHFHPNSTVAKTRWTSTALPGRYERITITTKPGNQYEIYPVGITCRGPTYAVVDKKAKSADPFVPSANSSGSSINLYWNQDPDLHWTQVDWAYSEEHLAKGWHATTIVSGGSLHPTTVGAPIALRITRHRIDGSKVIWVGWADATKSGLQVSPFPKRAEAIYLTNVKRTERTVPANPEFYLENYSQRSQWIALDDNEVVAKLTFGNSPSKMSTALRLSLAEGESVRLLALPLKPNWRSEPAIRATNALRRSKDPIPNVSLPPGAYSDYVGVLNLQIDEYPLVLWGAFEVDWALERKDLGRHPTVCDNEHDFSLASDKSIFGNGRPTFPRYFKRLYIRVTPIWKNGVRGRSYEGRIDRKYLHSDSVKLTSSRARPELPWRGWLDSD